MDQYFPTVLDIDFVQADWVFKLAVLVVLAGYIIYTSILVLRIRILLDTFKTSFDRTIYMLSISHIVVALVGGIIASIFILII